MGLGHVEPWDQRRGFSCHPSLSLCLPIHLSKPRLMREQWEPPQADHSISKAQSEGEVSEKMKAGIRPGCGQALAQRHPGSVRTRTQLRLAERRTAGPQWCWDRCWGPRHEHESRTPSPPPPCPAWPLAVNTQRTSSVSWEIFISGRVGSVCVGLLVSFLQVGPGKR